MRYLSEYEGRGGISARCVAASSFQDAPTLYTLETVAPKFIDAEFEKHRMFSSNSSSSRAIPTRELLDSVTENPWVPIEWRKNQPGMQGYENLDDYEAVRCAGIWGRAAGLAVDCVQKLADAGVHEQTANRLIEPFTFQRKVVTATEWDNFFTLPESQELARCMQHAMDEARVTELSPRDWHLPYVSSNERLNTPVPAQREFSAARCARVSYDNIDGSTPDPSKDLALAGLLLESRRMAPFEHQATPMTPGCGWELGVTHTDRIGQRWSANFLGWIQHRQMLI